MNGIYGIDRPVFVPEGRSGFPRLLTASLGAFSPQLLSALDSFLEARNAEGFLRFEEEVLRILMVVSSHIVGGVVAYLHSDSNWVERSISTVRESTLRRTRRRGERTTSVRFLGGVTLKISTPYVNEDRSGRRGRRRGIGRRGKVGTGTYPVLLTLGIANRATPALASEVARQSVRNASFDEAQQALEERGIRLDKKTVRSLALKIGKVALDQRQARIEAANRGATLTEEFAGRRIVIAADGGRVRTREGGRSGRRGKKGHRKYRTPWREPKLVIAYVIDRKGRKVKDAAPLYDGTLGDADAAFEILIAELQLRGAAKAKQIIVTGDGAPWIWNRANKLADDLGISSRRIVKVADFYHAVEHLTNIADLCAKWTPAERKQWVRTMRRRLKKGRVDAVIEAGRQLARGRNAKKIAGEVQYFEDRKELMRYDEFHRRRIPLGSGAVESAIRRVVNLRLKGASIFWQGPNAERMLHLRCYLKAGRWDELMCRVMHRSPRGTIATNVEAA